MLRLGRTGAVLVTGALVAATVAVAVAGTLTPLSAGANLLPTSSRPVVTAGYVDVAAPLAGSRDVAIPVTLSSPAVSPLTVHYALVGGSATVGTDVSATSGTLAFAAHASEAYAHVTVQADAAAPTSSCWAEVPVLCRTFSLQLRAVNRDVVIANQHVDDSILWLEGTSDTVAVGDAMARASTTAYETIQVPVTLAAAASAPVSVGYTTSADSAIAGVDYEGSSGTIRFAPGQVTHELTIRLRPSTGTQPNEGLFVALTKASGATIVRSEGWVIVATRAPGVPSPLSTTYAGATLTQVESKTGRYADTFKVVATPGGSRITTPRTVLGANDRMAFWPAGETAAPDEQSCATWSSQTPAEAPGVPIQEGLVLRAATHDGVTRAITVTKNVYANAFAIFNVHVWDTAYRVPFTLVAQADLGPYFAAAGGEALPLNACARVVGDTLQFVVWLADQAPPAWPPSTVGATAQGATVMLPAGWDYPGRAGWYVGHLPSDAAAVYTHEYAGPPTSAPAA
jgi:hypothetical protein